MPRVLRSPNDLNAEDLREIFGGFNAPIAQFDCGKKCAPHNPSRKPFCCDICHAVPAAFKSEWKYFQSSTTLWHKYRGDECNAPQSAAEADAPPIDLDLPKGMLALACLGPSQCERDYRALSCRSFPFFPYVTSQHRFIGLACEWDFETTCWVISNLATVSDEYRAQFIATYDKLIALFESVFYNYIYHSELMRAHYTAKKKRFPLLHRNGRTYLVSPSGERLQKVNVTSLPRFGFYK